MIDPRLLAERLRAQQDIYRRVLLLAEEEHQALRGAESPFLFCDRRRELLPDMTRALAELKADRRAWDNMDGGQRQEHADLPGLVRACQDLIMKAIVLDRENEQMFLRRGLLPASRFPAVERQQPHCVAQLYKRHHDG